MPLGPTAAMVLLRLSSRYPVKSRRQLTSAPRRRPRVPFCSSSMASAAACNHGAHSLSMYLSHGSASAGPAPSARVVLHVTRYALLLLNRQPSSPSAQYIHQHPVPYQHPSTTTIFLYHYLSPLTLSFLHSSFGSVSCLAMHLTMKTTPQLRALTV